MVEIIRLLLIPMHMRALDEAAFSHAFPVSQCQWIIVNRAVECRSPGTNGGGLCQYQQKIILFSGVFLAIAGSLHT